MDVKLTREVNTSTNHSTISRKPKEFSIDDLLEQVQEFHRSQQLEFLGKLTEENSLLQQQIVRYQESFSQTMNLLQEVCSVIELMREILERCRHKELAADRDWLAFWGIRDESTDGYYPAGWI